jgi:hypothetical protein
MCDRQRPQRTIARLSLKTSGAGPPTPMLMWDRNVGRNLAGFAKR